VTRRPARDDKPGIVAGALGAAAGRMARDGAPLGAIVTGRRRDPGAEFDSPALLSTADNTETGVEMKWRRTYSSPSIYEDESGRACIAAETNYLHLDRVEAWVVEVDGKLVGREPRLKDAKALAERTINTLDPDAFYSNEAIKAECLRLESYLPDVEVAYRLSDAPPEIRRYGDLGWYVTPGAIWGIPNDAARQMVAARRRQFGQW